MGLDRELFAGELYEELTCGVCLDVLEDPVSTPCGHTFCRACIIKSLHRRKECPMDRTIVVSLAPAIAIKGLIDKWPVKCQFYSQGCKFQTTQSQMPLHIASCVFDPRLDIVCEKGCGQPVRGRDRQSHNCVQEMKKLLAASKEETELMRQSLEKSQYLANKQKLQSLQEKTQLMDTATSQVRDIETLLSIITKLTLDDSQANVIEKLYVKYILAPDDTNICGDI